MTGCYQAIASSSAYICFLLIVFNVDTLVDVIENKLIILFHKCVVYCQLCHSIPGNLLISKIIFSHLIISECSCT